jgi:uncharacterized membrane protein
MRTVLPALLLLIAAATHAADPEKQLPQSTLRGMLTVDADGAVLRTCGAKGRDYWIEDRANVDIRKVYAALSLGPGKPVFMELRGVVTYGPKEGPGARYDRALLLEALNRAEREGRGCYNNLRRVDARALGMEPGWQVEITRAGGTFASLANPAMQRFPFAPFETLPGGTLRYEGRVDGKALVLTLVPERCQDSMVGNLYPFTATAVVDGREYRGCGYTGDAFAAAKR